MRMTRFFAFLFCVFFSMLHASATHINGGQIFYKNLNSLTVELTFVGYRDQEGVLFGQGLFDFGDGNVYGDDENEIIHWANIVDLGNGIERWEFTLIHTYPSVGYYEVSYTEDFRNAEMRNVETSGDTPFYVDALVPLDPFFSNVSPTNTFSPVFYAVSGERNVFNLSMQDEDGDSLSYRILVPKKAKGVNVDGYRDPADPAFYDNGAPTASFDLEPFSGNVIWDAPGIHGEYAIAVKTEEWRKIDGKYFKIGYTVLDIVIEVISAESFHNVVVPVTECMSEINNYTGQIIIENNEQVGLNISFSTAVDVLTFNGLSVAEWNTQNSDVYFTDQTITIDLHLEQQHFSDFAGLNPVYVQVNGLYDIQTQFGNASNRDLSSTTGFGIGIDCNPEALVLSSSHDPEILPALKVSKDQIRVYSDFSSEASLQLFDIKGRLLFDASIMLIKGNQVMPFQFEINTPYILVLHHKKGTLTEKFLLTK